MIRGMRAEERFVMSIKTSLMSPMYHYYITRYTTLLTHWVLSSVFQIQFLVFLQKLVEWCIHLYAVFHITRGPERRNYAGQQNICEICGASSWPCVVRVRVCVRKSVKRYYNMCVHLSTSAPHCTTTQQRRFYNYIRFWLPFVRLSGYFGF